MTDRQDDPLDEVIEAFRRMPVPDPPDALLLFPGQPPPARRVSKPIPPCRAQSGEYSCVPPYDTGQPRRFS